MFIVRTLCLRVVINAVEMRERMILEAIERNMSVLVVCGDLVAVDMMMMFVLVFGGVKRTAVGLLKLRDVCFFEVLMIKIRLCEVYLLTVVNRVRGRLVFNINVTFY